MVRCSCRLAKRVLMEAWREIEGFKGYDVSNLGRVRSWRQKRYGGFAKQPHILKLATSSEGYLQVSLVDKDGKARTKKVQGLVMTAFVGPRPKNMVSCHGPNGKLDNSIYNLKWCSPSENMYDAQRDGTRKGRSHGTTYMYGKYACRCALCKSAHTYAARLYREKLKEKESSRYR